jgi:hypothetical protein
LNYRIGGEFREGIFRARAGVAYFGDALDEKESDGINRAMLNLTAGVGMRLSSFYLDLALVHSRSKTGYSPYTFGYDPYYTKPGNFQVPGVTVRNTTTNAVLSFGTFFNKEIVTHQETSPAFIRRGLLFFSPLDWAAPPTPGPAPGPVGKRAAFCGACRRG